MIGLEGTAMTSKPRMTVNANQFYPPPPPWKAVLYCLVRKGKQRLNICELQAETNVLETTVTHGLLCQNS